MQVNINYINYNIDKNDQTRLVDFIRYKLNLTGTKFSCGEGSCGACNVLMLKNDNWIVVNSCLLELRALNGKSILTIEKISELGKPIETIQNYMVKNFASQCGFCSSGMICSIVASKSKSFNTTTPIDGNICRCTGYRPIVKTIQEIQDIEDLTPCLSKGNINNISTKKLYPIEPGYKWVAGYTSINFNKESNDKIRFLLNTKNRKYHDDIKIIDNTVSFGAKTTITELINKIYKDEILKNLAIHLEHIASTAIRNIGTIAGNIMMRIKKELNTEIYTLLLALDTTVTVNNNKIKKLNKITENDIILSFKFKKPKSFYSYRQALRETFSVAYVVMAISNNNIFTISLNDNKKFTKDELKNLLLTNINLYEYKLLDGFLIKYENSLDNNKKTNILTNIKQYNCNLYNNSTNCMTKFEAKKQVNGEIKYVDDIKFKENTLFGAYIMLPYNQTINQIPKSEFTIIDLTKYNYEYYAKMNKPADFFGQPCGLVLANDRFKAKKEAKRLSQLYEKVKIPSDIFYGSKENIDKLDNGNDKFNIGEFSNIKGPHIVGTNKPIDTLSDCNVVTGKISLGSQKHYYMETQTSYAIPNKGKIEAFVSSQGNTSIRKTIYPLLDPFITKYGPIDLQINTPQIGGAFGGKAVNHIPHAITTILSALETQKPIRLILDREDDQIMCGGRYSMYVRYKVYFKPNGKIIFVKLDLIIDSLTGSDKNNYSNFMTSSIFDLYNFDNMINIYNYKPPYAYPTTMISPLSIHKGCIMENIMHNVAHNLSMDPYDVKYINIEKTSQIMLESLYTHYENDKKNLESNQGISIMPWKYSVVVVPMNTMVSIYNDGTIMVDVEGVEMGQGLRTKVAKVVIDSLSRLINNKIDVSHIKFSNKQRLLDKTLSFGSTTTERACRSVQNACNKLYMKLKTMSFIIKMIGFTKKKNENEWINLIKYSNKLFINKHPIKTTLSIHKNGIILITINTYISNKEREKIKNIVIKILSKLINSTIDIKYIKLEIAEFPEKSPFNSIIYKSIKKSCNKLYNKIRIRYILFYILRYKINKDEDEWFQLINLCHIDIPITSIPFKLSLIEIDEPLTNPLQILRNIILQSNVTNSNNLLLTEIGDPIISNINYYSIYGVGYTISSVDLYTGNLKILKTKIKFEIGNSLNKMIDIGQIEGAFINAMGLLTSEIVQIDEYGKNVTSSAINYKPPLATSIPIDFDIELIPSKTFNSGFQGGKASGEIGVGLASTILSSVSTIINKNKTKYIDINTPMNCKTIFNNLLK